VQPDDLSGYLTPSDPQMHPDGLRAAFVVTRMDLEDDCYRRVIWIWDGNEARPFTSGPGDTYPRWSPDGCHLAFLRGDADAEPQLAVMAADGGEARIMTSVPLGASEVAWSPAGERLAVVAATWTEEWAGHDDEERARRPRRVTHLRYRFDDRGWLHDRRSHVYVVDPFADGVDPVAVTSDEQFSESGITWHPSGDRIAFLSARHPERHVDAAVGVWEVSLKGGELRRLAAPGMWALVAYSPRGEVHAVGDPDVWSFPSLSSLYRIGAVEPLNVTGRLDRSLLSLAPRIVPAGPQWTDTGFFTLVEHEGGSRLVAFEGGEGSAMADGPRAISGATVRADGSAAVMTVASPTSPGELVWWEGGEERTLTELNSGFAATAGLVAPQVFSFERDGRTIDTWVYLPPGDGPVPLLLNIHGGPASQYGWAFFDEVQVYVGAGYGVVACNPRGSAGYGLDHMRDVVGLWQEQRSADLLDVLAAVEEALQRFPRLDEERMGIMGGSYGGFAAARILSFDRRFRSAVVERALTAFTSFAGTSDIGPSFGQLYLGEQAPDGWDGLWKASPLATAHHITTPTLVIHAESDHRTPIEQGEQLFALLSRLGVETEMVRFPGGSHEMSRSGKPRHRKERFEAILDWHRRHIAAGGLAT